MKRISHNIINVAVIVLLGFALSMFTVGCATRVGDDTDPSDPNDISTENPSKTEHIHNLEYHAGESATCTSAGNFVYWHCFVCEENYADKEATQVLKETTVPATGHDYNVIKSVVPTCTEDGMIESKCSVCGDVTTETIPATGHSYAETVIAPTCTECGYTVHKCSACNYEYTDNSVCANGHNYVDTKNIVPTCTEDGIVESKCSVCGDVTTKTLTAMGHSYAETVIAPTCTEDGYTVHECGNCFNEYTDSETTAFGHNYEPIATEPTCTEDGFTVERCSRCDDEFTPTGKIPALGHEWNEETVKNATCTENGKLKRICNTCGKTEEQDIVVSGHSYAETVIEPTCTENGYTEYNCIRCDNKYTDNIRSAKGHGFAEEWSYDDTEHWHNATCGCHAIVEKFAHNYTDGVCECGKEDVWLYRLEFESDGDEYIVTGIRIYDDNKKDLDVVIPNEYNGLPVTEIADNAFKDNKNMKSVYIPNSVKRIGKNAFKGCSIKEAEFEDVKNWKYGGATGVSLGSGTGNADALTKTHCNNYWIRK